MSKFVIVDLEMCPVPKGFRTKEFRCRNELIQIGAVLLDDSLEITDTFMTFVHPEYGYIDRHIEGLTGITFENVKTAPGLKNALESFISWLPEDAILVSWSENDENQIRKETEGKGLEIAELDRLLENWCDCQKTFSEKMHNDRNYKLSEALIIADIDSVLGEHDALIDAKNTALLFAKMQREPELKLNPYLTNSAEDKPEGKSQKSYSPFACLLTLTKTSA